MDWKIEYYNKHDSIIDRYTLFNRTEDEAEREVWADVNTRDDVEDWTMMRIGVIK